MPESFETLAVFLVLLPGFLSARIVQALTIRRSQTEVDKLVQALVYSFIVYVCFVPLHLGLNYLSVRFPKLAVLSKPYMVGLPKSEVPAPSVPAGGTPQVSATASPVGPPALVPVSIGDVGLLVMLSLALGLGMTMAHTKDWPSKPLRKRGWSLVSARPTVWNDVFHDLEGWVEIQFADGRRVRGWFNYFSDTPEEQSLFLHRASWVLDGGDEVALPGPGILITNRIAIETVHFLGDGEASAKAPEAKPPAATSPDSTASTTMTIAAEATLSGATPASEAVNGGPLPVDTDPVKKGATTAGTTTIASAMPAATSAASTEGAAKAPSVDPAGAPISTASAATTPLADAGGSGAPTQVDQLGTTNPG